VRLVRYDSFDGIESLWVDEVAAPQPGPEQVIVRVIASCINPGSVSALYGAPYTPARDLAGIVVAVGSDAGRFTPGQSVLGWVQSWAAHAELVAVPADQLIVKPADLCWDVAGSLFVTPMAGLAGILAVSPQPEEIVVVSGASGGTGFTSAQLAVRRGATVVGLAGTANHGRLRQHGIIPVSYGDGQTERIRTATRGQPVDAFIDTVGSGYVDLAVGLGVPSARINTVVDFAAAKRHGVTTHGTMQAGGLSALQGLADLTTAGDLVIPIAAGYPLSRVQDAYRLLATNTPGGRVVLHP
jgi:NADPH2:quinone reductase